MWILRDLRACASCANVARNVEFEPNCAAGLASCQAASICPGSRGEGPLKRSAAQQRFAALRRAAGFHAGCPPHPGTPSAGRLFAGNAPLAGRPAGGGHGPGRPEGRALPALKCRPAPAAPVFRGRQVLVSTPAVFRPRPLIAAEASLSLFRPLGAGREAAQRKRGGGGGVIRYYYGRCSK